MNAMLLYQCPQWGVSNITDNLYQYYNGDKSVKVHHGNGDTGDTRQWDEQHKPQRALPPAGEGGWRLRSRQDGEIGQLSEIQKGHEKKVMPKKFNTVHTWSTGDWSG